MSPEIFGQVARNAELGSSKFYHAQQHPSIHTDHACFGSSKIKEQDVLLSYHACFVVHQRLKREIYYT